MTNLVPLHPEETQNNQGGRLVFDTNLNVLLYAHNFQIVLGASNQQFNAIQ